MTVSRVNKPLTKANRRALGLLDRECVSCRACCTTVSVKHIDPSGLPPDSDKRHLLVLQDDGKNFKPADVPCPYLEDDQDKPGCSIWSSPLKPSTCDVWECVWRSGSPVLQGPERPDRIGVVFDTKVDKRLPFTFLVAVAIDPKDTATCFTKAHATIERLAKRGHLVVCETPDGNQLVLGPEGKKLAYLEIVRGSKP